MLIQLFSISKWCWFKVWVCANYPVRVSSWYCKFLQHFLTMREIIFVVFLVCLVPCRLNNTDPYHNIQPPACSILYIWPIIHITVHCHIHRKTQIDPMTTLSVPPRYLLVSTYEIRRREELCVILIKISNEVFNKFSPMSLMARTFTSYIYLMAPLNMPPQNIKTVSIHIGLAKSRSSPVILLRDSIPQDGPASKFEIFR